MSPLEAVSARLPEPARDIRLNLQSVLGGSSLSPVSRLTVAIACAWASGSKPLARALEAEAQSALPEPEAAATIDDARAAAALMSMNNIFYRFRHFVGKEGYRERPARLRMGRIARPLTDKATFELACLAVSAIHGCEDCVKSHELTVLGHGKSEDDVMDTIRLAAVVHAAAVGLLMTEE
ncbi:MAG: hypothetical protein RIT28_4965 [Pseudomonadota bacterium]